MTTTRYWFVRHGESLANAEGWLAGHRDVPLTALGVDQAKAAKAALVDVRPDRVVSSDLRRAVDTARLAWDHRLPPSRTAVEVRERDLGAWEGRTIGELAIDGGMATLLSWDHGPPGGESHLLLGRRALGFLAARDDGASTLLFGHGGWIRTVVGLVDCVPLAEIGRFKVANTEVLIRDVERGTWARWLERLS
ncbi:MAG: histidine phosphatase family protein [Myxococcota bacterium]